MFFTLNPELYHPYSLQLFQINATSSTNFCSAFWSISNVTNSSFLLSWLSDYSIYYITISPSVQANKNTSESSKMFKGLLPGTNYQVKIEVMNSTNSRILLFTTNQITSKLYCIVKIKITEKLRNQPIYFEILKQMQK